MLVDFFISGKQDLAAMAKLDTEAKFQGASMVGQKYHRLAVVKYAGKNCRQDAHWECLCDCGSVVIVRGRNLKNGNTKSCGCFGRECNLETIPLEKRRVTFWSRVEKLATGCWEWRGLLSPQGYGVFDYSREQIPAHRFSWFLTYGIWPTKPYVCHRCDNRRCVNPDHLFEGTAYDNNHDAISKGRMRHWGRPKSTPEMVIQIRDMYATGEFTYKSLADRLALPLSRIHSALIKWKTLPLYATQE